MIKTYPKILPTVILPPDFPFGSINSDILYPIDSLTINSNLYKRQTIILFLKFYNMINLLP